MEIKPPGESWTADLAASVDRWLFLLDQYFATQLGVYTAVILTLAALVGVVTVYFLLSRSNVSRKLTITFAVAVGFAFVVQTLIAVNVPRLAEEYGYGFTKTCQVFERDEAGNLVYDPYEVTVKGEKKIAMIARHILYRVDSSPVSGQENGYLKLGFLLVPATQAGAFPVYCGIPFNQEAQKVMESINLQKTPMDTAPVFEALLMREDGYEAFILSVRRMWLGMAKDELNPGVMMFLQHLATQLKPEDIQPLTPQDLVKIMSEAGESLTYSMLSNVQRWTGSLLEQEFERAGMSAEDAEYVRENWMKHFGVYQSLFDQYIIGDKDPADVLPSDVVMMTLSRYGIGRQALLDMMNRVIEQINLRYSGLYAAEVVRAIEELKLHERRPLITLPGEPPWYLIDPPEGGEGEGEGQEGEEEGEGEGEGQTGEEAAKGAYEDGINNRISGERFGPKSQSQVPGGGKDNKDRS